VDQGAFGVNLPNQPGAVKGGIASLFQIERSRSAVTKPDR